MAKVIYVWRLDRLVGRLVFDADMRLHWDFGYRENLQEQDAVSLTMPISHPQYPRKRLHPVFDQNLPEGDRRAAIARAAQLSQFDDLDLLCLIGANQVGLLRFTATEDPATVRAPRLDMDVLRAADNSVVLFDGLMAGGGAASGVAGLLPKVLAISQPGQAFGGGPAIAATHIVKRDKIGLPGLVLSEYLVMEFCRRVGLQVPRLELSKDGFVLAVERFDTTAHGPLGMEDLCTLAGKPAADRLDGSFEMAANKIRDFAAEEHRVADLELFYRQFVVCNIVGNADAHLKNFCLLYPPDDLEVARLSPVYDMSSTLAFEPLEPGLTLHGRHQWWPRRRIADFGHSHCELTPKKANDILDELCAAAAAYLPELESAGRARPYLRHVTGNMAVVTAKGIERLSPDVAARLPKELREGTPDYAEPIRIAQLIHAGKPWREADSDPDPVK